MQNVVEIRVLLVTTDPELITDFIDVCRELGIEAQSSASTHEIPQELAQGKYEAVLVDFDTVPEALTIMGGVRESRGNRNALIFAVATNTAHQHQALRQGANFIFEGPIEITEVRRLVCAAYDLMVREGRRYFRCTAEIPALLSQAIGEIDLKCVTINISSSGMALKTPSPLHPGQEVRIALFLPGAGHAVRASGTVVWDDKHGKTGLNFRCDISQEQNELDAWLNVRFHELLTPRRVVL